MPDYRAKGEQTNSEKLEQNIIIHIIIILIIEYIQIKKNIIYKIKKCMIAIKIELNNLGKLKINVKHVNNNLLN